LEDLGIHLSDSSQGGEEEEEETPAPAPKRKYRAPAASRGRKRTTALPPLAPKKKATKRQYHCALATPQRSALQRQRPLHDIASSDLFAFAQALALLRRIL
jgi:hypothetical protein